MSNVSVDSTAIIEENVILGDGTKVWHFAHIMKDTKIGTHCVIADYVHVGKKVKIGNNVKLENGAIEDNVFVGPNVTFTNDVYPRSFNKDWRIQPTLVKEGSSIGAGAVIVCGVTLGEYTLVGAAAVVTSDLPPHALAYGNPARIRGFVCRCGKKLKSIEKTKDYVCMKCSFCEEKYQILPKNYSKIVKKV
jgi:UDP-2-acetamido-3-amino-2,3-dideoxy-glucuronate N-acetyltransferase